MIQDRNFGDGASSTVGAHHALIARVRAVAQGPLAKRARDIDLEGLYPADLLRELASAGLFAPLSRPGRQDIALAADALAVVSEACGSTGFIAWCHMACALYLSAAPDAALHDTLLARHVAGDCLGGTALSNPVKAQAKIEALALRARSVEGGYRVSGSLPWVSHIAPGQYCGAVAELEEPTVGEMLFLLRIDDPGILTPCPSFSGMTGTSTWRVSVNDYFVPERDCIAKPAASLMQAVRAPFMLLQCGLAIGIVRGAITDMLAADATSAQVNRYLDDRPDTIAAACNALAQEVRTLAAPLGETPTNDVLMATLRVRADAATLALRATQSALLHQGARGYLSDAAPQRRLREAQFVAIVTPTLKHLRMEIDRLATTMPDKTI